MNEQLTEKLIHIAIDYGNARTKARLIGKDSAEIVRLLGDAKTKMRKAIAKTVENGVALAKQEVIRKLCAYVGVALEDVEKLSKSG